MKKQYVVKWKYLSALILMLIVLLLPITAWADDVKDEEAPVAQPLLQWSDDLSYAKYLVRNYAYYDFNEQVLEAKDVPTLITELQKIDRWAQYFSAEEYKGLVAEIEGDFVGIGVYVDTSEGKLMVQGVMANSPAERAGLRYGDIIVGVDELKAPQATAEQLMAALGGEENSLLVLKYQRDGRIIEELMNRKLITLPSMEYWLMKEVIGYIRIDLFTTHTGEELAAAVRSMKKQGLQALVVDLRDCPGGELDGAVMSCGVLAGVGPMMFFVSKDGWDSFAPVDEAIPLDLPLAVLINEDTASAAELVAANVQDNGAGVLIGVPSYGKGVMQSLIDLPSGAGIKFTTNKIVTHGYQDIDFSGGVMPDIYVTEEEEQLAKALSWLQEQLLKPGFLKFYIGLAGFSQGGQWQDLPAGALLDEGASYVPLELTLDQLGWQREKHEGIIYFSKGVQRLIIDEAEQKLITSSGNQVLISRDNTLYLPAALLRKYGYTITWNSAERSVRIEK
ncbi:MAG: S41 family peptidase [Firmicutes bacterium]|nr:S41 family peptidase [Bacillota bacterium]